MQKTNLYAPSFLFRPATRKKVDKARLLTDIIGLGLVYTFGSLLPASIQWLVSIYSIMAWVTILTLDPSRLPDAAATKINQQRAWRYFGILLPLYTLIIGFLVYKIPINFQAISIGSGISLIIYACLHEIFYRNILQVKLRQLGLTVFTSIFLQSLCFAVPFYLSSHSLFITAGSIAIGIMNGFIVYKTRSIYPNILITIIWLYLF